MPYSGIIAIMILTPITMGYVVGMVHVRFMRRMHDSSLMGRTFGSALGISIIVQFLIQIRWNIGRMLAPVMCIMCISLIIWEHKTADDRQDDDGAERKLSVPGFPDRKFIILIMAAACFDIPAVYLYGQMERAFDTADFFSWPRLLYGAGFMLMGFLWDLGKGHMATVVMTIAAIASVLMPVLLIDDRFHIFDICFFYFYLGMCLAYNSLRLMWHYSVNENMYAAVAYRVLDNLLTAVLVLAGFSALPMLPALIIDV